MRAGKPVVFAGETMPDVIRRQADAVGATLIRTAPPDDLPALGLAGEFQRWNAAGVLGLLQAAGLYDAVQPERVASALAQVEMPGRCEQRRSGGVDWMFDVAHNPAAADVLAGVLAEDPRPTVAIVGTLDDKDEAGIFQALAPQVRRWIAMRAEHQRALAALELARRIANAGNCPCLIAGDAADAVRLARQTASENDRILVTGSFFTVGPIRELLELEVQ